MTAVDVTLLASVISGIFLMIGATIGMIVPLYRRTDQVRDQVAATKEQITNKHETHIRDDLDHNTTLTEGLSQNMNKLISETEANTKQLTDHIVEAALFRDSTNARLKTVEKWEGRIEAIETLIHSN